MLWKLLIGFAALLLLTRFVLLEPLLAFGRARANRALDVDNFNRKSDYSKPGFAPVHNELINSQIRIEGQLPADLEGLYLRNGTNSPFDRNEGRRHMFNGAGMIHQIDIRKGQASYTNRYTLTPRYLAEKSAGRELYIDFGDVAGGGKAAMAKIMLSGIERKFGLIPNISDVENSGSSTAIQYHHGKLYALQENNCPFVLNCRMEDGQLIIDGSGDYETFGGLLQEPYTAHPKIDPISGDWYSFSTDNTNTGRIHYDVLSHGVLSQHEAIAELHPAAAFVHDCCITENYAIVPDLSMKLDGKELMGDHKSVVFFDPSYKMRFGVIKRGHKEGDEVQWFTTEQPGHIWHTINSWEEQRADGGTDIVLFAPVFKEYSSKVPIHSSEEAPTQLFKFRLNLQSGEVSEERCLLDHFYERPSLNTAYVGKPSRYAYLLDEGGAGGIMGKGVLKYDLIDEQEVAYFDYGDYRGGEALFIPKADSQAEDDGYLLDLLMSDDKAYLVVIDAGSMQELAKLHLPQRVPYGVHACWLNPEQQAALTS